jgi:hypothetical protein
VSEEKYSAFFWLSFANLLSTMHVMKNTKFSYISAVFCWKACCREGTRTLFQIFCFRHHQISAVLRNVFKRCWDLHESHRYLDLRYACLNVSYSNYPMIHFVESSYRWKSYTSNIPESFGNINIIIYTKITIFLSQWINANPKTVLLYRTSRHITRQPLISTSFKI